MKTLTAVSPGADYVTAALGQVSHENPITLLQLFRGLIMLPPLSGVPLDGVYYVTELRESNKYCSSAGDLFFYGNFRAGPLKGPIMLPRLPRKSNCITTTLPGAYKVTAAFGQAS